MERDKPTANQLMNKPGMAPRYSSLAGYDREGRAKDIAKVKKAKDTTPNKPKTTATKSSRPTANQLMNKPGMAPRYSSLAGYDREGRAKDVVEARQKSEKQKAEPKPKTAPAKGKYDGMSFGAAFNAARDKGEPTFPWTDAKGVTRTYTTQTKEEADAKKKTPAAPKAEAAPKRRKFRQDKPSGTFTPAKVSVPKVTQKVKKLFSPKPR